MDSQTRHTEIAGEVILPVPMTHPDAQLLVAEVQLEYVARYGGEDRTPVDPRTFEAPRGAFFVAYRDGVPVATGAWRRRDDIQVLGTSSTAEVKRMYVVPAARGTGLARRVLARLEDTAAAAGVVAMILETGSAQPEAMALYESSGYARIDGFGFYRDSPENRCYARLLSRAAGSGGSPGASPSGSVEA